MYIPTQPFFGSLEYLSRYPNLFRCISSQLESLFSLNETPPIYFGSPGIAVKVAGFEGLGGAFTPPRPPNLAVNHTIPKSLYF